MHRRNWLASRWFALHFVLPGIAPAAPFAYIPNSGSNNVSVVDTATNTVAATVPLGGPATGVAVGPAGTRAYVASSQYIFVIDTATNAVTSTVTVGTNPSGIVSAAVNPAGTRLYVTNHLNQSIVSVIDTATNTVLAIVPSGDTPQGVVVNPAGTRVYVANKFSQNVSVIDTATNAVVGYVPIGEGPCRFPSPVGIAINPAGTRIYVANENCLNPVDGNFYISVIDVATNTVAHVSSGAGGSPRGIAVSPDGTRVYVSNGGVIDTASNTVVATMPATGYGVAVNPAGTRIYLVGLGFGPGSLIVVDTATNTKVTTIPVGSQPFALGQFIGPASTLSAANPDLNQHGLTGSWYEAATGGQGVEVEVFANPSSGTGSTFVSWFTYDTVVGGAERQRWYTAQGPVVTGRPNASLTIYQNTGGNFNAPPITTPQPVGIATLTFDTCTSGQLSYSFTDGTGRTGTIPLTRLTQNVTCSTTTSYPTNADFALSGNWFGGPATSGQGFTVEVNPTSGAFFAAWYTYLPNGAAAGAAGQRWYTAQAVFTPGLRSMPVTIFETTGGVFDTPTPPGQQTVPVGTGTMAFQNCSAATFSYNFTGGSSSGLSGSINLSRVGPLPPGCTN